MKNIRHTKILIVFLIVSSIFSGCTPNESPATDKPVSTQNTSPNESNYFVSSNKIESSFTNAYGTSTTICAHPGCTKYIASSGDTNCCTTHSNKCLNCNRYIDEDAMYCMDCLTESISGKSSGSSVYSSNKSGSDTIGASGYDMPNEDDKSFSDYVKKVDPDLYDSLFK